MLPKPHPKVIFRQVSDGAVLLHLDEEVYFGLNPVGVRIWQLLPPECGDIDDLCRRLAATYPDVPLDVIRTDAIELIDQLQAGGLVEAPRITSIS